MFKLFIHLQCQLLALLLLALLVGYYYSYHECRKVNLPGPEVCYSVRYVCERLQGPKQEKASMSPDSQSQADRQAVMGRQAFVWLGPHRGMFRVHVNRRGNRSIIAIIVAQ